jgi:hypothetical protein
MSWRSGGANSGFAVWQSVFKFHFLALSRDDAQIGDYLAVAGAPAGFGCKFYSGPGKWWFNHYAVGILHEIFWMLPFFFYYAVKHAVNRISLWAFADACILAALQPYQDPRILKAIRPAFIGRTLMDAAFDRRDFTPYTKFCCQSNQLKFQFADNPGLFNRKPITENGIMPWVVYSVGCGYNIF